MGMELLTSAYPSLLMNNHPHPFTARFAVGQNLYIYKQSLKSAATNWQRAITDWYNEVELFGKERVKPFRLAHTLKKFIMLYHSHFAFSSCRFSTDIGHYRYYIVVF